MAAIFQTLPAMTFKRSRIQKISSILTYSRARKQTLQYMATSRDVRPSSGHVYPR